MDLSGKRASIMLAVMLVAVMLAVALPSNPVSAFYLYENNYTNNSWALLYSNHWMAQTFTPASTHWINSVRLYLYRTGSPGTLTVSIQGADGSGHPSGAVYATATTDGNTLTTGAGGAWRELNLSSGPIMLTKNIKYSIVVRALTGAAGNGVYYRFYSSNSYGGGNLEASNSSGGDWFTPDGDVMFDVIYDGSYALWLDDSYVSSANGQSAVYGAVWQGQTFTLNANKSATEIDLNAYRVGLPGQVTVSIRATSGGFPIGPDLTYGYLEGSSLTADTGGEWKRVHLATPYHLRAGVKYAIVVKAPGDDLSNCIMWRDNSSGTYAGGNEVYSPDSGFNWHANSSFDYLFRIYGVPSACPAIFRQGGTWFIDYNRNGKYKAADDVIFSASFGKTPGDKPLAVNWNGVSSTPLAVFRPSTAMWYLDLNQDGVFSPGIDIQKGPFGSTAGDVPLATDFLNDGREELAIFRQGGMWYTDTDRNGVYQAGVDLSRGPLGQNAGDVPLFIDWEAGGTPRMAIFRPSTGMWYIDMDNNGSFQSSLDTQLGPFGTTAGDIPVAIDWDGDGRQEAAIFRTTGPDVGKWFIDSSRNGKFGAGDVTLGPFGSTAGDVPLVVWWPPQP